MPGLSALGRARIRAYLAQQLQQGAAGGAEALRDALSRPGSGVQYAGQPNPSSTPDEYSAEQSGDLQRAVESATTGPLSAAFGFGVNGGEIPPQAVFQEFRPISAGGRANLAKAVHDPVIQEAVRVGLRKG